MDCLFCKIINKEIPAKIIHEDENFLVFLDLDQTTGGHTLIVPKKHFQDFTELDEKTNNEMWKLAQNIGKKLMTKLNKKGLTLQINYGESQEIKHVHLHLLPNYQKETNQKDIEEIYNILKDEN